ncbi:penicillin acylase family protein [Inhella proteolytica]|uniref:Penicillin acylase family protein n=1 Tax=Inhella proteolytica TaxID=2795029 RepID=A0A931IZD0_9BURK|nr:penicillin acylase family protein [Inhella proteolytica]MBH9575531.1 penicillin acylase family protein [Inhella proteolytica]
MTRRWLARGLAALALLLLAALLAIWLLLRASLPPLQGELPAPGLAAPVELQRDARGTASVHAANRSDAAYGIGVAHGQDRFFQMDTLRRAAAGEMAALVGAPGLKIDRATRGHGFRARAEQAYAALSPAEQGLLQAYAAGVNRGLQSLGARPPEYWLLRQAPAPWQPVDSLLAVYAMYLNLQADQLGQLRGRMALRERLGAPLADFLLAPGIPELDAPLDGVAFAQRGPIPAPPPGWGQGAAPRQQMAGEAGQVGSNAWAVGGARRPGQPGLLANDMHLSLGLPNTWYRMALHWRGADGRERRWVGVTLPGMPALVVGSTGQIAWGFTNSYVRSFELLPLEPAGDGRWRGPDGREAPLQRQTHTLTVAGSAPQALELESSPWGPVERLDGRPHVRRWQAYRPDAVNLQLLALEDAADVPTALALAPRLGMPTQNQLLVDRQGHLAWTPAGPLLGEGPHPQLQDPADGRLWSANHRHLGGAGFERLGDGGYGAPGRAARVRERLRALDHPDEAALAAIALDDQAPMLQRWQALLLRRLDAAAPDSARAEYRRLIDAPLQARPDAVAYTLVRGLRTAALEAFNQALAPSLPQAGGDAKDFSLAALNPRWDEPVLRLYEEQPAAWRSGLPELLALVDAEMERLQQRHGRLADARWGETESIRVRHPLSAALPAWLGRHLDAPPQPMVGDTLTPRAQARSFGASERLVVAPGEEARGLFAMPGGPSGHPLSPFYLSDHADWAAGRFGPLLPGAPLHRLQLRP